MLLWIRMKKITLLRLINQRLIYVRGEVCKMLTVVNRVLLSTFIDIVKMFAVRSEIGEFVEYDLDNEDEDWLEEYNKERKNLTAEK